MQPFLTAFARDLAELECGPLNPELGEDVVGWGRERVAGAGDVTRLGLTVVGLGVAGWVRLRTGSSYTALDTRQRSAWTRRIAGSRAPGVSELVRAVRSLTVTFVYEARHAPAR